MRGKSKYQEHMGKCLIKQSEGLKQPEKMKSCAAEWRKLKGLPDPPPKTAKKGKSNGVADCVSVLMTSMDGCPVCKETKEIFKEEIKKGNIEVMDVSKGEGKKLAEELGISGVPTFVCKKTDGESKKLKGLEIAKHFKKEGF